MSNIPPAKLAQWQARAKKKEAIVPRDFEIFADHALIECGACGTKFSRNLVPFANDPTFVCPNEQCHTKNWLPIRYEHG